MPPLLGHRTPRYKRERVLIHRVDRKANVIIVFEDLALRHQFPHGAFLHHFIFLFLITDVIHTVGPQDMNAEKLAKCYENSLAFHKTHKLTSIAFPCISTGIYGFPNRLAAHIALKTARKFLEQNPEMERIIFCLFMPIDVEIYETLMQMYFPVHEWNYPDDARSA